MCCVHQIGFNGVESYVSNVALAFQRFTDLWLLVQRTRMILCFMCSQHTLRRQFSTAMVVNERRSYHRPTAHARMLILIWQTDKMTTHPHFVYAAIHTHNEKCADIVENEIGNERKVEDKKIGEERRSGWRAKTKHEQFLNSYSTTSRWKYVLEHLNANRLRLNGLQLRVQTRSSLPSKSTICEK